MPLKKTSAEVIDCLGFVLPARLSATLAAAVLLLACQGAAAAGQVCELSDAIRSEVPEQRPAEGPYETLLGGGVRLEDIRLGVGHLHYSADNPVVDLPPGEDRWLERVELPLSQTPGSEPWAWIVGGASGAAGQVLPWEPEDGFLAPGLRAGADVFERCLTDLEVDHDGVVVGLGCSVSSSTPLGGGPTAEAWILEYRRGVSLDYDDFVDTLSIDELVLLRLRRYPDEYELLWHLPRIRAYEFLEQVESAAVGDELVVSYLICLNGTGGCVQHFLHRGDVWRVVDQQPYLDALAGLLPDGWSLHKGRRIDLRTLQGVQPMARRGDANCCPSGEIRFTVTLEDGQLRLAPGTVVIDPGRSEGRAGGAGSLGPSGGDPGPTS